jgi:ATPase subunit of ABC transporter with duplicated ATPase domains
MLARLMAQRADCLFLDEPTNDLDIPSREALEEVLASYEGALFVVSHDRYLLKRLAERVVAIRDGAATIVDGDYETYERLEHAARKAAAAPKAAAKAEAPKVSRKAAHQTKLDLGRRKRAVAEAEQRVADLEAQRAELERRFTAPNVYDDPDTVVTLQRDLDRVRGESDKAMALWERAVHALEA